MCLKNRSKIRRVFKPTVLRNDRNIVIGGDQQPAGQLQPFGSDVLFKADPGTGFKHAAEPIDRDPEAVRHTDQADVGFREVLVDKFDDLILKSGGLVGMLLRDLPLHCVNGRCQLPMQMACVGKLQKVLELGIGDGKAGSLAGRDVSDQNFVIDVTAQNTVVNIFQRKLKNIF